jgi:hypothetical protein
METADTTHIESTDKIKDSIKSSTFIFVEIINYFYVIIIQLFPAIICANIFNKIFCDRTKEEYKQISTFELFIELWIHFWSILVLYYIFRYIFIQIPSPFENLLNSGFKNNLIFETSRAYVFTIIFFMCQPSLKSKVLVFKDRLFMYT